MSAAEIKTDLIKIIINSEDIGFLRQALSYFTKSQTSKDWWEDISTYEQGLIEAGAKEIENGEGIPYQQVRDEIRQIIQKK